MANDDGWISTRVAEARKLHPLVTEAVAVRAHALLKGRLSERQLSSAELTSTAATLIAGMSPASPQSEATE